MGGKGGTSPGGTTGNGAGDLFVPVLGAMVAAGNLSFWPTLIASVFK